MRKGEFLATLALGIILGVGFLAVMFFRDKPAATEIPIDLSTPIPTETVSPEPTHPSSNLFQGEENTPTPQAPLAEASATIKDSADVLLLYNPKRPSIFSANFCLIAQYYGLGCRILEVTSLNLIKPELLLDENGKPLKLIGIDARLFDTNYRILSDRDIKELLSAVKVNGVNIYIGMINSATLVNSVQLLTDGAVTGIFQPQDTTQDWMVTTSAPEITKELTGLNVVSNQTGLLDNYSLNTTDIGNITPLITSKDDLGKSYPVFLRIRPSLDQKAGSIFIDSNESGLAIDKVPLRDIYYSASTFVHIVPLMMAFRYSCGNEIWHSNANYANLTLDDGVLSEPYQNVNYSALLEIMRTHNFHTTVALNPSSWESSDPNTVTLFLSNPDYFSLVQYGNSGMGYEFPLYEVDPTQTSGPGLIPTRTLRDQELSITEGLSRMKLLENTTGLSFDPIMIFPGGISPKKTFELLKSYGYLGTANDQDLPLGENRPSAWDYGMYPAVNDFFGFPNYIQRTPGRSQSYEPALLTSYLDLFIGKPVLFYTYASSRSLFAGGMDGFNPIADEINRIIGPLEWRSLGYIARHLYSEKENDDGSLSIKMYSRELILSNDKQNEQIMHISLPDYVDIPAAEVTINGYAFPFRVEENQLKLDISVPAGDEVRISIEYRAR